jgi:hypothetical protein
MRQGLTPTSWVLPSDGGCIRSDRLVLQQFAAALMRQRTFSCKMAVEHEIYNAVNHSSLRTYEKSAA